MKTPALGSGQREAYGRSGAHTESSDQAHDFRAVLYNVVKAIFVFDRQTIKPADVTSLSIKERSNGQCSFGSVDLSA